MEWNTFWMEHHGGRYPTSFYKIVSGFHSKKTSTEHSPRHHHAGTKVRLVFKLETKNTEFVEARLCETAFVNQKDFLQEFPESKRGATHFASRFEAVR